ncbi:Gfo/Idh/MocA family oxidoreductase [Paenibacillus polysaccharolyticus]|uniref:Gfo/Idh/MocA family oxidoreductase n=1 Tax=Paenibacillus polysaccharolyticus TaxID=582692 RepID=UPI00203CC161|nr:Gfo/Idh/MocA family oxidoreductase [Paenibacillus polysaccharolyticus]MCM3135741.1 Gfo/Idh/MocA family oxidoreductase [Paenibacillus polysaccharolyticus]
MKKVITYGTFDLFHEGHRRLLERAKALGDYLIVGVTTEQYDIQRGKMNVVDSLMRRIDNVRSCGYADEIIVEDHESQKIGDVQKFNVDIFVVGSDWRGTFDYLNEYCDVVYLERTKDVSSTELRIERNRSIRLGIVGSGRIAERTLSEVKFVSGITASSVYNPRLSSAKAFAERFELATAFDQYDMFLNEVDSVYIASPHETHYEYARQALLAGKHVLCEKPMVLRENEARELYDLAQQTGLVLMEAIKTAYAPSFLNLLAIAKSGRIGKIYDVEATFTKLVPSEPGAREYLPTVGGSFTELASYNLLPILKLLGTKFNDLRFDFFKDSNGVDIYTKAYFRFDDAMATVKTGIGVKSEGQLLVSGTKGYIQVKSPWWLTKTFEVCYENLENNESFSAPFPGFGMRFELADFVRNINELARRNYKLTPEESITMASIMERFLQERKGES